jgi:hypothetical protein
MSFSILRIRGIGGYYHAPVTSSAVNPDPVHAFVGPSVFTTILAEEVDHFLWDVHSECVIDR